jgi:hypothetical protein
VQRFGSALQLNVHFHVLVPDGAFDEHGVFVAADPPDDEDVRKLLLRAGRRVVALLRRFFGDHDARRREIDGLLEALDATSATSATPAPALFPRPERRASLSAFPEGFSLHAATRVMASDRRGLWRLCAYGARGGLAASRLSELPDGRFADAMKHPLPDGRARLVLTGVELIEKLVPLRSTAPPSETRSAETPSSPPATTSSPAAPSSRPTSAPSTACRRPPTTATPRPSSRSRSRSRSFTSTRRRCSAPACCGPLVRQGRARGRAPLASACGRSIE